MNASLTGVDFAALSPFLIVIVGSLIVLLIESFTEKGKKNFTSFITLGVLVLAILAVLVAPASDNPLLTPWVRFDPLARVFALLFLGIGIGSTLLADTFFEQVEASQGEYFFLLLSALFGLLLIGYSADFLMLFLGLETLSIALYVLCGYIKRWNFSHEGAMKYFFMGSLAAAFLLYGIALIYGAVGTLNYTQLLPGYHAITSASGQMLFLSGIAMITVGLAFKAAIVPLHAWAPDVYEGAPTPVTAFMAVGTKAGAFAALTLVFLIALPKFNPLWNQTLAILAYPTLIYANTVAIRQTQLRRFFAYSGISHAGYLIIPLAVGTPEAIAALLFYLIVYALATLGCFAVLGVLESRSQGVVMEDLRGLFRRSPLLAAILAICFLTLAGLPPTVGFYAKFYVFKLGFQAGFYALVIVALLTTILSAFFYLRFIAIMYADDATDKRVIPSSWPAALVGILTCAALIILSCYPTLIHV